MGCFLAKEISELESLVRVQNDGFHDKYRLGPCLGKGSFGTVYLAECKESSQKWAVKVLRLTNAQEKSGGRTKRTPLRRALDEKDVLDVLGEHPNILALRVWYVDSDFMYLVMRCCKQLVHSLADEPELNEHTYAQYFKGMAAALAHIHSRRVIHRDVKHDNFLVQDHASRTVKLCDFGLSVVLDQGRTSKREDKCGSAPYMSPEMVTEHAAYGTATDVWSLGVTVYTSFFGTWPYFGRTASQIKNAIRLGASPLRFRPPKGHEPNAVSNVAIGFVRALLIRDPQKRPSANECLKMDYLRNNHANAIADLRKRDKICLAQVLRRAVQACCLQAHEPEAEASTSEAMAQYKVAGSTELQTEEAAIPAERRHREPIGGGDGTNRIMLVNI